LIVPSIAPHAVYTTTEDILRSCAEIAVEYDVPLHIHISETSFEVENMRRDQGMPVVPYVKKLNLLDAKVLAAHCVHLDDGEMRTFKHYNTGVAHNPSSNMKLASGIAPIKRMLDLGLNVGIGTDGPASNNDLDMFEEIRLASFLAKGSSGDPTALPARQTLAMATRLGAAAMHMGHLTGSLEPGKRADLILVDISPLHNSPRFRRDSLGSYAQLVYAAKAVDVSDVMVNGTWLMRERQLTTIDEAELLQAADDYARKIDVFLIRREKSLLSKLLALGEQTAEEESFEVQAKVRITNRDSVLKALKNPEIEIVRNVIPAFDIYFSFDTPTKAGCATAKIISLARTTRFCRYATPYIDRTSREHSFPQKVVLSRSRFLAAATQTPRFYREYFKPTSEVEIEKDRLRFLVRFKGTEFFINLDDMKKPKIGQFLEIKSRTWSRNDAEKKSRLVVDLIRFLGESPEETLSEDYVELAQG